MQSVCLCSFIHCESDCDDCSDVCPEKNGVFTINSLHQHQKLVGRKHKQPVTVFFCPPCGISVTTTPTCNYTNDAVATESLHIATEAML